MVCAKCGAFFNDKAAPLPVFCHKCDDHHYDKAAALGIYEKALAAVIINLKSKPVLPSRVVERIDAIASSTGLLDADVVFPVPLSAQRNLERGFNQAELIAAAVGRSAGIRVDAYSLRRPIHTPIHRGGMDQKARDMSVRKAFEVARPKLVAGKTILLVDDILTSGSTASYCAKVLKKNGAARVNVFTLARAVKHYN